MIEALEDEVLVTQNVKDVLWFISVFTVNFSIASQTNGLVVVNETGASAVSAKAVQGIAKNVPSAAIMAQAASKVVFSRLFVI